VSGPLALRWRPFHVPLPQPLVTARGVVVERWGWLLRLEATDGRLGWGEAAPLELVAAPDGRGPGIPEAWGTAGPEPEWPWGEPARPWGTSHRACAAAIDALGPVAEPAELERALPRLPAPLGFAVGAALAELQGLVGEAAGGWGAAPASAWLLPAGEAMVPALESWLASIAADQAVADPAAGPPIAAEGTGQGFGAAAQALPPAPQRVAGPGNRARTAEPPGNGLLSTGPEREATGLAAGPRAMAPWTRTATQRGGAIRSGGRWLPAPPETTGAMGPAPTLKWKVATCDDRLERELLEHLLRRLPAGGRLRLDANGGWDRATAARWADRLASEPRLDWLEQPLADEDLEGLTALSERLPVALDESLALDPGLRDRWTGWQVRRPALEGDPRPLLAALAAGRGHWMVSTAFETSVGRRLVEHAAALQWRGPTPAAPGLAPQWRPQGPLFDGDPAAAWAALAGGER
jgi:O-succinylbenzoate synthase